MGRQAGSVVAGSGTAVAGHMGFQEWFLEATAAELRSTQAICAPPPVAEPTGCISKWYLDHAVFSS